MIDASRPFARLLGALLLAGAVPSFSPVARADTGAIDAQATYSIPAGPLGDVLNGLAVQANLQIFFEQSSVAGVSSSGLSGTMSARDALGRVLQDTPLEFIRNADDTILVRPRMRTAARRHATPPPALPAADVQAPAPSPAPILIPATEGDWLLRARLLYLDPRNRSDAIAVAGVGVIPADGVTTGNQLYPELDVEHYWSSHWSTELAVTAPQHQDLNIAPAPPLAAGRAGSFRQGLNDLTMKYTFDPDGAFRPYLGAGVNYTTFSHVNAGALGVNSGSAGPVAQVGFDVKLGSGWFFNADAKWAHVRGDLQYQGNPAGQFRIDPVLYGIGIGYRFGGTPARTVMPEPVPVAPAPMPVVADSDGDGVPDSIDLCPNTPHGVAVDAHGCPLDSDGDGVPDYLDKCPGTPLNVRVDANGCEIDEMVLRGVTFDTGSARLTAASDATLDAVAAILRQRPAAHVEIHGYTDSVGSDALNQRLSERRAQAVVDYLVSVGIPRDALGARGFGKQNPIAPNTTAEGRAENRRVTVEFNRPVPR